MSADEIFDESIPQLETRAEVMFFDTDVAGVVHNVAYLRMIEVCRTRLATRLGMDLARMHRDGTYPAVTRTEIDYRSPARLGDVVRIIGKLTCLERSRFWVEFEMRVNDPPEEGTAAIPDPDDPGRLVTTCRQSLAVVQMPPGKPVRIPAEWREKWPELIGKPGRKNG
jgi:YbgC/YbaW family acyl-CoA thioester hydrolase